MTTLLFILSMFNIMAARTYPVYRCRLWHKTVNGQQFAGRVFGWWPCSVLSVQMVWCLAGGSTCIPWLVQSSSSNGSLSRVKVWTAVSNSHNFCFFSLLQSQWAKGDLQASRHRRSFARQLHLCRQRTVSHLFLSLRFLQHWVRNRALCLNSHRNHIHAA